jgi:hypothetical protein
VRLNEDLPEEVYIAVGPWGMRAYTKVQYLLSGLRTNKMFPLKRARVYSAKVSDWTDETDRFILPED